MVLPHKASRKQDVSCLVKLRIIKRFEFTSQTMKSGAVVVPEDAPEGTALLLVKGAPNVIKHMARASSVPENFDRVIPHQLYTLSDVLLFLFAVFRHVAHTNLKLAPTLLELAMKVFA